MLKFPDEKIIRGCPPKFLLFDSCLLQNMCGKMGREIGDLLALIQTESTPRISDYSIYELLRGANRENNIKITGILNKFQRYRITAEVLVVASLLDTLYREEKMEGGDYGDKILAATSVLTQAPIVTQNGQHFPRPFFDEMNINFCKKTIFEYGNKRKHTIIHFLEPDYKAIKQKIKLRK